MPATLVLRLRTAAKRSALSMGPARRDPKTTRAFSSAEDGGGVGEGGTVAAVAAAAMSLVFLGGGFLTVVRGDLGEDVGGCSGFTSGTGCGFLRMDS